ncbi:MAG: M20/M25/M40 family metallo-hydrolase [Candidatus Binatia bacterium]|nr:M20/M25/M40 family metallo-hydrolase [Candidatus Binatia bacterium]
MKRFLCAMFLTAVALACTSHRVTASVPLGNPDFDAASKSVRRLLTALVAANTTNPPGNEARAVALGKKKLEAAGIPFEVTEFAPGRENLVARLAGDGSAEPILLLAHIDVVGTEGQDWSVPAHTVTEKGGYLYGRGVNDDLGMAAIELEVLLLLNKAGVALSRDVILAWTGDEESGGAGIEWLLENAPDSVRAEVVLNEGGGLVLNDDGEPTRIQLQTAEKTYQDFTLTAYGPTGHSSVPLSDNAIYRISRALSRVGRHRFPARLLPVTRANLAARASQESGDLGHAIRALSEAKGTLPTEALEIADRNASLSANLRTTCVATMIDGGTRVNALPAEVRATINCRILPDETVTEVEAELVRIISDPEVEIESSEDFGYAAPSPLNGPGPDAIAAAANEMWPGLPIVPFMSRGATDSRFLRAKGIPAYGIDPIAISEEDSRRAHGIDERIPTSSLKPAVEFLYRVVVELAAKR